MENILGNRLYTINHIHRDIAEKCTFLISLISQERIQNLKSGRLHHNIWNDFAAPFVAESHIKIGPVISRKKKDIKREWYHPNSIGQVEYIYMG
ncbi:MAG: hypothetical protein IPN86_23855 [Saprospiraceae bacterium]|nr:hypothetical protein [Saprospiraceae bacterium]